MTMEWDLEPGIKNKTMEEMLIEVYGCISQVKIANRYVDIRNKRINTEFYLAGNAMETMIIEVFGCNPPDGGAIKIKSGKDKKRINKGSCMNGHSYDQNMILLPVNA